MEPETVVEIEIGPQCFEFSLQTLTDSVYGER